MFPACFAEKYTMFTVTVQHIYRERSACFLFITAVKR